MSPVTERPTVNLGERLKAPTHSPERQNSKERQSVLRLS